MHILPVGFVGAPTADSSIAVQYLRTGTLSENLPRNMNQRLRTSITRK